MRAFSQRELREALAYADAGHQALHLHRVLMPGAPSVFVKAVKVNGGYIAHLFDRDAQRLEDTARRLGVKRIVIERFGVHGQHVDLCMTPLTKAIMECDNEKEVYTEDFHKRKAEEDDYDEA